MTTRQTAAFAAILLVGCGNPQPPTVEDFTEAAQPIPTPEPQTATIETPDVPLWEAARIGNIEAVRLHLAGGMDANAKDESGWAPLHGASGSGQREIVELLLANGAKVNVTALSGKTAPIMRQGPATRKPPISCSNMAEKLARNLKLKGNELAGYSLKSVRISVCSRLCSTRANGVSLPLAREARNASALPSPEASTHTARAAAKAG